MSEAGSEPSPLRGGGWSAHADGARGHVGPDGPSPDPALRGHPPPQRGEGSERGSAHLAGRVEAGRHLLPIRVYYEDTDFSGVVYHANYLRFLERGRTDSLRLAGVDQSTLHARGEGLIFAVRRMTIEFLRPARMDDVLTVETSIVEARGASLVIAQRILRGEDPVLTADVRVAALVGGRPARIPDELRAILEGQR